MAGKNRNVNTTTTKGIRNAGQARPGGPVLADARTAASAAIAQTFVRRTGQIVPMPFGMRDGKLVVRRVAIPIDMPINKWKGIKRAAKKLGTTPLSVISEILLVFNSLSRRDQARLFYGDIKKIIPFKAA